MRVRARRAGREPVIALINIVFLMLIFFVVAGTLARPLGDGLELVRTETLGAAAPPDALVLHADGALAFRGAPVADAAAFWAMHGAAPGETVRVVPDRAVSASDLVALGRALQAAGAARVVIVTRQALR